MSAVEPTGYADLSGTFAGQVADALQRLLDAVNDAWREVALTPVSEGEARRWAPVCKAALALADLAVGAS